MNPKNKETAILNILCLIDSCKNGISGHFDCHYDFLAMIKGLNETLDIIQEAEPCTK